MESYDREQLYARNTHIYLESNPNPNSLKFVVNYMLVPQGSFYDFPDALSAERSPLAKELFKFPYVERVFIMSNFITITKSENRDWIEIKDELKNYLKNYLDAELPVLEIEEETEEVHHHNENQSDVEIRIRGILDEYIKPAVEMDGGAIAFHSFNDGVVKVLLQGSCSGCPSSMITLKAGIESLLKTMIPEVTTVEAEGL